MGPLVDTSVLVDYFRGSVNPETSALDRLLEEGTAPAVAPVIVQEVLQGYQAERDADLARKSLAAFAQLAPPGYDVHRRAAPLLSRDDVQRRLARFAGVTFMEVT